MSLALSDHHALKKKLSIGPLGIADVTLKEQMIGEILRADRAKRGALVEKARRRLGMEEKTVRNLCTRYAKALQWDRASAWEVLWDKRRFPAKDESCSFPPGAYPFLRSLVRDAPTVADAYKAFMKRWRRWLSGDPTAEIPGWGSCPQDAGQGYPHGCSERSFEKFAAKHVPKRERVVKRRGMGAAAPFLAQVLTSRVGTYVGAVIQLDDMWHNLTVSQTQRGRRVVGRLLQYGAVDVHSGSFFDFGLKVRTRREDGTHEELSEKEARWYLAQLLLQYGYHPTRGTVLNLENAKMTVSDEDAQLLHDYTGGMLRVSFSPMTGGTPAIPGFWEGVVKGNYRHKSLIERLHELVQRYEWQSAALGDGQGGAFVGQTGRHRGEVPEALQAMMREEKRIARAIESGRLTPERLALLRLPFPDLDRVVRPAVDAVYAALNERTDHEMEGWRELGYVVGEYRRADRGEGWFPEVGFLALPAPEQEALRLAMATNPHAHMRERRLSPAEVWQAGRRELKPIANELAYYLIARDCQHEAEKLNRSPKGAYFVVKQEGTASFYETRVVTMDGHEVELSPSDRYRVVPMGDRAFIARPDDGAFIGTARLAERINPLDRDWYEEACGYKAMRNADALATLREDHAHEGREVQAMKAHNAAVIGDAPPRARKARPAQEPSLADAASAAIFSAHYGTEDDAE